MDELSRLGTRPVATFSGVSKMYDDGTQALSDVSFDLREGELLSLLGPEGSGCTTCLMMLAGFEMPTSGSVMLGKLRTDEIAAEDRGIGVVFRDYDLFPHLTVGENLAFPLEARTVSRASHPARIERALKVVGLPGRESALPAQLTAGEQQRVAIARALVFEPRLVLLDEPLAALDRRMRMQMQFAIRRIQKTLGVSMVYATHDKDEAIAISDRVAVFNAGRIEEIGPPEALYEEPATAFVARFLGDSNVLDGRIASLDGEYAQVEVEDGILTAFMVDRGEVGDRVVIAIRPERVAVDPAPGTYSNEFVVDVEDIVYLGDRLLVRTDLCGNPDFVVKIPNVIDYGTLLTGDRMRIGWTTIDCRALPPEEPSEHDGGP